MKLIFIIVIFAICNSCGTKKLPTETVITKVNPADQDFDLLTKEQEEKLGSDPTIPDYPLLIAKMRKDHPLFNISLEYKEESTSYNISTKLSEDTNFQNFLFSNRDKQKAMKAYISSSISLEQTSPFIKLDQITNLKINLYFEKNNQKVYLLKNYFIEEYRFNAAIELKDISLKPHETYEALFDKKEIFVEVDNFNYQISQLDKSFEFKNVFQLISKQHGEVSIKESQLSQLDLYGTDLSTFDLISYWDYSIQGLSRQDDQVLKKDTLVDLTDKTRKYMAQTYRSKRVVHNLVRKNGLTDSHYFQAQTNSEEYLVKTDRRIRIFQTRNHPFKLNSSLIPSCSANIVSVHQTPKVSVDVDFFNNLIQFDIPRSTQKIDQHHWKIESSQQLTWKLSDFTHQTLIGDTRKSCLKYAHLITNYLPIKSLINEMSLAVQIIGMSRQEYLR